MFNFVKVDHGIVSVNQKVNLCPVFSFFTFPKGISAMYS